MLDRDKAEHIKDTVWPDICGEIDAKIAKLHDMLLFTSPERLVPIQEKIKAFIEVKGLLDDVIDQRSPDNKE